jgi:GR25 family glycosyltransferase involved in LPS biosynthesis/GT2 family glycosyltransferase
MNKAAEKFIHVSNHAHALQLLRSCRLTGQFQVCITAAKYLLGVFPRSVDLLEEFALIYYFGKEYRNSYDVYKKILYMKGLTEQTSRNILRNQSLCIEKIQDSCTEYDKALVAKITSQISMEKPVTFSITSCKRFDLFQKSMNSFLNCCEDVNLIGRWICVDDNSSQSDRDMMCELYPFFEFHFKSPEEKGHPKSMNIIRRMTNSPYLFHMEDDWVFFDKSNYITECLDVLNDKKEIKQCLINKNYAERAKDIDIIGGNFQNTSYGTRYYIHEMVNTEQEKTEWETKHGYGYSSNYWPHFSFRPSIIDTQIFADIGEFSETDNHFEMDYSWRFFANGYRSAFLEGVYSIHIGRLTSERNDITKPNAYVLNNEAQFTGENTEKLDEQPLDTHVEEPDSGEVTVAVRTVIINLDRRPDRMEELEKNSGDVKSLLAWDRISAIDGEKLKITEQLQRIFEGNDYNMRKGMVGCAMSHLKLCCDIAESVPNIIYCILEDDITFVPNFKDKFVQLIIDSHNQPWDIIYLGHHMREQFLTEKTYSKTEYPLLERWNTQEALSRSLGGTGGYLIKSSGAQKFMDFIERVGMTNGIDTMQQKACDELIIMYPTTHLIYTECYRGEHCKPDSDIQYDHSSLTLPVSSRLAKLQEEGYSPISKNEPVDNGFTNFYLPTDSVNELRPDFAKMISDKSGPFYYTTESPDELHTLLTLGGDNSYSIDNVFVCNPITQPTYVGRLKINGKFDLNEALQTN